MVMQLNYGLLFNFKAKTFNCVAILIIQIQYKLHFKKIINQPMLRRFCELHFLQVLGLTDRPECVFFAVCNLLFQQHPCAAQFLQLLRPSLTEG